MIYLDHHATTPLDPRVLDAMLPYLKEKYGNPASRTHKYGWDAEEAVENAREQIAKLISCSPHQIVFTSGATESNNTILRHPFTSVVTSSIEHSSVVGPCMCARDRKVEFLQPNDRGVLKIEALRKMAVPQLISVMLVNNEIGTIQDIARINTIRDPHCLLHSDMAQAIGKIPVDVEKLNVDFASFSAHKIYGPKGVGALFIKESDTIEPLMRGGSQEYGVRSGTLNVPGIVGFGKACEIAKDELHQMRLEVMTTREQLLEHLIKLIPGVKYHNFMPQVPGSLHVSLPCDNPTMLLGLLGDKVAISTSSACMSINNEPSRILNALSMDKKEARRSVRFCTGRFNTMEEMREAAEHIAKAVKAVNTEGRK